MTWLRTAVAACCVALGTPAGAQIDVNGTWAVSIDNSYPRPEPFTQNGTVLDAGSLGFGTIDPSTGMFHVERGPECVLPGDDDPSAVDGTFSADGRTFTGTYSVIIIGTPSHPCIRWDGFVVGDILRGRQTLLGRSLAVKDPRPGIDPSARSIVGSAKEKGSTNTLVGDPTSTDGSGGAVLQIFANGTASTAQDFALPQGTSSSGKAFWDGSASAGFKYRDPRGDQGPVKLASIKRSSSGTFSMKVMVSGRHGTVDVVPPDAGSDGCMALQLGIDRSAVGDRYSVQFGPESTITNLGATLFKASSPALEGHCPTTIP